jgi:formylmethanofuran dehydrogenase subunit E-like metal-binding protein
MMPISLWAVNFEDSVRTAMKELQLKKGSASLCVISNAIYVDAASVDILSELTGCTIGKGNMLFVHSPSYMPLQTAIFSRDTRDLILLRKAKDRNVDSVRVNVAVEKLYDEAYWNTIKTKLGTGVSFAAICNVWADGAPYDFLKCVEYHNHFCPGVTSGYLLARYIKEKFPLKEGQSYLYIASPVWCKEDAIQYLLDLSPGKKGLITRNISKEQITALPLKQPAGILVVRDKSGNTGIAHVLSFDFELANRGSENKGSGMKKNPFSWKDSPDKYCSVLLKRTWMLKH